MALAARSTTAKLSRTQGTVRVHPKIVRQRVVCPSGGDYPSDPKTTMEKRAEKMFQYIDKEVEKEHQRGHDYDSKDAKVSYLKEDQAGAENRQVNKANYLKRYKNQEGDDQADGSPPAGSFPTTTVLTVALVAGLVYAYMNYMA